MKRLLFYINSLLIFFLENLCTLHFSPKLVIKLWATTKIAAVAGTGLWITTMLGGWYITNRDYIIGVLVCIGVDHLIGSFYHAFRLRDFTLRKNAIGLITKLALCACAGILFEIIHHTVQEATIVYEYMKMVTRLIVILYPAGSAFMNMSALTNGVFPPVGWINKIKAFNKDLDVDKLKGKSNQNSSNDEL